MNKMTGPQATVKPAVDGVSFFTIGMALLDNIPEIAAGAALVWTLIRIWETQTVTKLVNKLRGKYGKASSDS